MFGIADLIIGDLGHVDRHCNIIVKQKVEDLTCISDLHPNFITMHYPILFLYSEDDFRIDIRYKNNLYKHQMNSQYVIRRKFYVYRLQQRINDRKIIIIRERLFQ